MVNTMPWPFYPWERCDVHCAGGWVSSRASLDGCGKCHPCWNLIPRMSSLKQITIPTMISRPFTDKYTVKNYEISSSPKGLLKHGTSVPYLLNISYHR